MRLYKGVLLTTTLMPYMGNGIDVPYLHFKGAGQKDDSVPEI